MKMIEQAKVLQNCSFEQLCNGTCEAARVAYTKFRFNAEKNSLLNRIEGDGKSQVSVNHKFDFSTRCKGFDYFWKY